MITLEGNHFIYGDVPSLKYGLIFGNVETSPTRVLSGNKSGKFVFNKALKARYLADDDYTSSPLSLDVEIVTCDGHAIDLKTLREIERWLFTNSTFKRLYIEMSDDPFGETYELVYGVQKRLYFNCRFLYPEKIEYNGGVVGFKCTLETDGMMLWQDEITHVYDMGEPVYAEIDGKRIEIILGDIDFDGVVSLNDAKRVLDAYNRTILDLDTGLNEIETLAADYDEDGKITLRDAQLVLHKVDADVCLRPIKDEHRIITEEGQIVIVDENANFFYVDVDSDIDGYTYPTIKLYTGKAGGAISIYNNTDSTTRSTEFEDIPPNSELIIDCRAHRVGGDFYQNMTKKNFPRLVEGKNEMIISGDVIECVFVWQNRRFL